MSFRFASSRIRIKQKFRNSPIFANSEFFFAESLKTRLSWAEDEEGGSCLQKQEQKQKQAGAGANPMKLKYE